MKSSCLFIVLLIFYFATSSTRAAETKAGFYLPDDVSEVSLKFQSILNLVVLPVIINDSIQVNLILDTGCRNMVLFGRRFQKLFQTEPNQKVQFSGLGDGNPVHGKLSLNNKVSIQAVIGEKIPVVIVPEKNLFSSYANIHGVIGYDIFIKFEIELDPIQQVITFRPAATSELSDEYEKIPLVIEDSRPLIKSEVFLRENDSLPCDLMLDTGSSLGLLMKTTDLKKFSPGNNRKILGRGLNGNVVGFETIAAKLILSTFEISAITAGITHSAWHNYASVGMEVMKNYNIVLNYCKAYAGFKRVSNAPTVVSQYSF
jgi:hypothetical protein